jgi:hypothetical protein
MTAPRYELSPHTAMHYIFLAFAVVFAAVAAALAFGWFKDSTSAADSLGFIGLSLAFGWAAHF